MPNILFSYIEIFERIQMQFQKDQPTTLYFNQTQIPITNYMKDSRERVNIILNRYVRQLFHNLLMSYITYSPNDVVYIRDVGYATLLSCGSFKTITQKTAVTELDKKQSIIFDPDLFNSDSDRSKSVQEKLQKKISQAVAAKNVQKESSPSKKQASRQNIETQINIVKAKMQGNSVFVYTSDKNLSKTVFLRIKPMLVTKRQQITIQVQISKTIDTLRKAIFNQLGQPIANYYNIKLGTINPIFSEFQTHSKTIAQCLIKDNQLLILTAQYAFTFHPVVNQPQCQHKISVTNALTLNSTKKVAEPLVADSKVAIALPASTDVQKPAQQNKPQENQKQPKKQQKTVQQSSKKQQKQQGNSEPQNAKKGPYHAKCTAQYSSGRKYWEIKIDKTPQQTQNLLVGVCTQISGNKGELYHELWGYQVLSGKKVSHERDLQTNILEQDDQPYGYILKQNDNVGVLLSFSGRKAILSFYKNSIFCGEAFVIDQSHLRQGKKLIPFVSIGGEGQVTLDSKAHYPLDSYRHM